MGGGEMIETVKFSGTTYAPLPMKFEAGTQNFNAVPAWVPALDCALRLREDEAVKKEQASILAFVYAVEGAHHEDLALILDKMGIAVRSGQMCAEPLMDRLGVTGAAQGLLCPV